MPIVPAPESLLVEGQYEDSVNPDIGRTFERNPKSTLMLIPNGLVGVRGLRSGLPNRPCNDAYVGLCRDRAIGARAAGLGLKGGESGAGGTEVGTETEPVDVSGSVNSLVNSNVLRSGIP